MMNSPLESSSCVQRDNVMIGNRFPASMATEPGTMASEPKGKHLPVINNGNYLARSTASRVLDHRGSLPGSFQVKCLSYETRGLKCWVALRPYRVFTSCLCCAGELVVVTTCTV